MDLNLDHYNLNDLMKLFKIQEINTNTLKQAKRIVYKVHPDKSNLDSSIYIFFSKAYKLLEQIYLYKNKKTIYSHEEQETNNDILKFSNTKEFSYHFNRLFEKTYIRENEGHGEWLKQETNIVQAKNIDEMNNIIKERKRNSRTVVKKEDIGAAAQNIHYELVDSNNGFFGNKLTGNLKYDDIKNVHGESIIPVTEEDIRNNYNSLDEYQKIRNQNIKIANPERITRENERKEEEQNTKRVFELLKKDETYKKMNDNFISNFKRIIN